MKGLLLYFNKRIVLLIFLVMQMEAFAQRGRFIPQDWGGGGGSSSHGSGFGEDLFVYIVVAVILVCYIIFKIQSFNAKGKESAKTNPKSTSNPSVSNNGHSISNTANNECKTQTTDDTSQKKVSRFASDFDEYIYNERIRYANKLLNNNKEGLSFGEKELDIFSKIRYNRVYIEVPNNAKEIPLELFEMSKARVIFLPTSIERIDVDKMQKFDIVIIPKEKNVLFRKMLESYKGIIIDNNEKSDVWLGNPISLNDFILIHGCYELKQPNEYIKMHYIVTNDGKNAYFTKRLEDKYNLQIQKGENSILENADLLIEEYYSVEQKKFYLGIYER